MIQRIERFFEPLWLEYKMRPHPIAIALCVQPAGLSAIVLGEGASRAFMIIGGGDIIPTILGVFLMLGGLLTLIGACRPRGALIELIGLSFTSFGSFIYATGVIAGLGWNGIIAGMGFAGIFLGSIGRVFLIAGEAQKLARRRRR